MSKKKKNKMLDSVYKNCASASDCTGLVQKISVDEETLKRYHEQFNKDKK
jgi:hypothetical protein